MPKYSAKQRGMRGIGGRSKRQFLQLYRNVKRSMAYHGLSVYARCLLFELIDRYTGSNNGMIGLGVREARYELGCSAGTISNAMRELDDAGLAHPTKVGAWRGKQATEWRLMFLRCHKTGDLPVTQWEQRMPYSEFTQRNAKVHEGEHREGLSSRGRTQKPKNPMNECKPSSRGEAHVDIYQGKEVTDGCRHPKRWTKPYILSDEPRDFKRWPLEEEGMAA